MIERYLNVGFTGTRRGMTSAQLDTLDLWLRTRADEIATAHHGACIGADEQFALLAGKPRGVRVVAHPPDDDRLLSEEAIMVSNEHRPPQPYLARNHAIVDACEVLLAAPQGSTEKLRSGTWATVRYARKAGKFVLIFWPNGRLGS